MEKRADPPPTLVPIFLLGGLLIGAAIYILVLRGENAELRARLSGHGTAAAAVAAAAAAAVPEPAVADVPVVAPTPSNAGPARLSEANKTTLRAQLDEVTARDKHVWFVVAQNSPGATALAGDLAAVFRQAGWPVDTSTATFAVRPGIFMFGADEQTPNWVDNVLRGLRDIGFEPTIGLGYRAYYDERKRTIPGWNGFPLAPGQPYVLVIGPR